VRVFVLLLNVTFFGSERLMVRTAQAFKEDGADVLVATCDWEFGAIRRELSRRSIAYSDIVMRGHFTKHGGPRRVERLWFEAFRSALRLVRTALRFAPTHIVIPDETILLYAIPALLLRGRTVAVYVPATPPDAERAARSLPYRLFLRYVMGRLVDVIIANSRYTIGQLRPHLPGDTDIRLVPCCVPAREEAGQDAVLETIDPRRFNVVFVGRLSQQKGVDLLIDAARQLAATHPDVDVLLAGPSSGTDEELAWRTRVNDEGLGERVRFIGGITDVPRLLRLASVHVMPSRWAESFGLVVLEAKNAGVPSVVTPAGALAELVRHKVDGFICRDVSAEALVEGIEFFLRDRAARAAAGDEAAASAGAYGIDRFKDQWASVLAPGQTDARG